MREHWGNCITHFDDQAKSFVAEYFHGASRVCLLIAGAGFDPRSQLVAQSLNSATDGKLRAIFIREERGEAAASLRAAADANEIALRQLVPKSDVWSIDIFSEDNAPVGGNRIGERLNGMVFPDEVTDIVLDMSALSLGVAFPAARILLALSEKRPSVSFHLMVASNPELDARIVGEPAARSQAVRGFSGAVAGERDLRRARIWLPQLAPGRRAVLEKINVAIDEVYKVCPILPFPASDPRRADSLIEEYGEEIRGDWAVDDRDYMYVSERNPLDSYRSIDMLKRRYDKTVAGVFEPQLILSPVGSKVMATGAMMAAIRHDLPVHYVETLRYDTNPGAEDGHETQIHLVHIWLDGPIYDSYATQAIPADADIG